MIPNWYRIGVYGIDMKLVLMWYLNGIIRQPF